MRNFGTPVNKEIDPRTAARALCDLIADYVRYAQEYREEFYIRRGSNLARAMEMDALLNEKAWTIREMICGIVGADFSESLHKTAKEIGTALEAALLGGGVEKK